VTLPRTFRFLALLFLLPAALWSNVLFVQEVSPGNYVEVDNTEFARYFPLEHEKMQAAFQAYQRAQEVANQVKASSQKSPLSLLSPLQNKDPLIISLDNGDWAYNEMYGKQVSIGLKNGRRMQRDPAPLTRIGRNMPQLNNRKFMGEVLAHETGHAVMNVLFQGSGMPHCSGGEHTHDSIKDPQFAMVEGFAEYFAASTFGDPMIPRSYDNRNREQLNASEGFVASVLLGIDEKFGQDAIFETIAQDKPVSLGQFAEAFLARNPQSLDDLLEIMRKHSGKQWPMDSFLQALKEGTLDSLDLDGDGLMFPPKPPEFEEDPKELAQEKLAQAQIDLELARQYQKELLENIARWGFLRDYLLGSFPRSSWRDRIEKKVTDSQNNSLMLYEHSRDNIFRLQQQLESARKDLMYWDEGNANLLPLLEHDSGSGGIMLRPHAVTGQ